MMGSTWPKFTAKETDHRESQSGWRGNGFALEWLQNEVTLRYPRRAVNKQMNIPPWSSKKS